MSSLHGSWHRRPLAPFGWFLGVVALLLPVLLIACGVPPDSELWGVPAVGAEESRRPQDIDPRRFALIAVGMPESQVLEILGIPFESNGPPVPPGQVPTALPTEDCDHKTPCLCAGAVKELFYYRGSLSESFHVYIDGGGLVCCYHRSHEMEMSFFAI